MNRQRICYTSQRMKKSYTTWVEVNTKHLAHNITEFRKLVGKEVLIAPTVKANAYGHGILEASKAFIAGGADWLCVHSVEEGVFLRINKIKAPILIIGYVPKSSLLSVVKHNLKITLYDLDRASLLQAIAQRNNQIVDVHLKLETGINRQGLLADELINLATKVQTYSHLNLEGVSSHLANVEDTDNPGFTNKQINLFEETITRLSSLGIKTSVNHLASSAGAMIYKQTRWQLIRPGISAYGYWPSLLIKNISEEKHLNLSLKTAFTWKALVAQVKSVNIGEKIGYGCTYEVKSPIKIAVIPVGYYEGFDRKAGASGYVLIRGTPCKVVGRVCMNNIMVDITHLSDVEPEEEVVLIGKQGEAEITPELFASWIDRIVYEIPTRVSVGINGSIPRIAI